MPFFCVRRKEKSENIGTCSLRHKTIKERANQKLLIVVTVKGGEGIGWKEWKELVENNTFLTIASYIVLTFRTM